MTIGVALGDGLLEHAVDEDVLDLVGGAALDALEVHAQHRGAVALDDGAQDLVGVGHVAVAGRCGDADLAGVGLVARVGKQLQGHGAVGRGAVVVVGGAVVRGVEEYVAQVGLGTRRSPLLTV